MTPFGLISGYDGLVCDLDGVVVAGPTAIEHAVEAINALPVPVVFATNNASRSPHAVGEALRSLGVQVRDQFVLTSSRAAAQVLGEQFAPGSAVMAVGGPGVAESLDEVGLLPTVPGDGTAVVAVLQGYGAGVTAADLGEAAHAVRAGARWVVTNEDATLPTVRGPAPGNGALVAAVRRAVEVDPEVIGKPHPPMYSMAARGLGVEPARLLAVGDRLETDIAGAHATGMDAALVLTGVHSVRDAASAPPERRPTHVIADLRGLLEEYPEARRDGSWCIRGIGRATWDGGLVVEGEGLDAVRAALDVLWQEVDAGRISADTAGALLGSG